MKKRWAFLAVAALATWSTSALAQGQMAPGAGAPAGSAALNTSPWPGSAPPVGALPSAAPSGALPPFSGSQNPLANNQTVPAPTVTDFNCQPNAQCGCSSASHFTPYMLGDFIGPIGSLFTEIKVGEGDSPRPMDRFFFDFNYYNNIFKDRWLDPAETLKHVDYLRYVLGFEKTFMDEKLSVTVRIPFFTIVAEGKDPSKGPGEPDFTSTDLGNISAIFKGVLWENKATGSLISAGASLSVPTAASRLIDPGPGTGAFVQPFMGFILQNGDFYVQGFSGITLPLVRPEAILLFNDVGVGYFIYRSNNSCSLVRSIAPTLEAHIMDPLRQADPSQDVFGLFDKVRLHNNVDMTAGGTIEFANRSTLGLGVSTPVTGPKPFEFEILAQFNVRY